MVFFQLIKYPVSFLRYCGFGPYEFLVFFLLAYAQDSVTLYYLYSFILDTQIACLRSRYWVLFTTVFGHIQWIFSTWYTLTTQTISARQAFHILIYQQWEIYRKCRMKNSILRTKKRCWRQQKEEQKCLFLRCLLTLFLNLYP